MDLFPPVSTFFSPTLALVALVAQVAKVALVAVGDLKGRRFSVLLLSKMDVWLLLVVLVLLVSTSTTRDEIISCVGSLDDIGCVLLASFVHLC